MPATDDNFRGFGVQVPRDDRRKIPGLLADSNGALAAARAECVGRVRSAHRSASWSRYRSALGGRFGRHLGPLRLCRVGARTGRFPAVYLRVILNPTAASGNAARRQAAIVRALTRAGSAPELVHTRGPGDAGRLVREARRDGVECVVIVGGDGTLNDAVQGYLEDDGSVASGPDLALIPSGTGGDFRRSFGLSDSIEEAAQRLLTAEPRPLDLGLLSVTSHEGSLIRRAFINITSFGIGGLTDRIVNSSPKWIGGKAAFFLGTLRAMVAYTNAPVRVRVDGEVCLEAPILNVALANGRYFGGGMLIAPDADTGDGWLDVVALHDLSRLQGVALAQHIYKGSHLGLPGVSVARGKLVEAEALMASTEVLVDMDGETPGRLPLRAELAPGALRLRI
jgi:diacylglycerol kinase (ATP)